MDKVFIIDDSAEFCRLMGLLLQQGGCLCQRWPGRIIEGRAPGCDAAGMDDFLTRPISPSMLFSTIQKLIQNRRHNMGPP
jgi:hypothetical protein